MKPKDIVEQLFGKDYILEDCDTVTYFLRSVQFDGKLYAYVYINFVKGTVHFYIDTYSEIPDFSLALKVTLEPITND